MVTEIGIRPTKLGDVFELEAPIRRDERGYLVRTHDCQTLARLGQDRRWVQESLSYTAKAYTIRGLHVQRPPHAEAKLITIVRGTMRWVVVDLRRESPTFGAWHAAELHGESHSGLLAGKGFAHGCVSLSDDCLVIVKSDRAFVERGGTGIVWNDTTLAIDWGIGGATPILSDRDRGYPSFADLCRSFDGF